MNRPSKAGGSWLCLMMGQKFRLEQSVVGEFGLFTGREISENELCAIRKATQMHQPRRGGADYFGLQRVAKELRRRLVQKGESEEMRTKRLHG